MARHRPFIIVAGSIGVGKSTVVEHVSDELGLEPYYETVVENPFLENFYQDMSRWSFHSQMFFLEEALREHQHIVTRGAGAIQDRSIYEHYMVFGHELHEQGHINQDEYRILSGLYYSLESLLSPPDLLVYLHAPAQELMRRVHHRGRKMEQMVDVQYLQRLHQRYQHFLDSWFRSPVVTIDTTQHDVRAEDGCGEIAEIIIHTLEKL